MVTRRIPDRIIDPVSRSYSRTIEEHDTPALPAEPEALAGYVADLADHGYKPATISRRLSGIARAHRLAGIEPPTRHPQVGEVASAARRLLGTAHREAEPITATLLARMVRSLDGSSPLVARDRALLLVGFAVALRRSELVALDVADLAEVDEGLIVTVRQSKTDQESEGATIGVAYGSSLKTCPVRAVRAWVKLAEIEDGPLFRPVDRHGHIGAGRLSDRSVSRIVQRAASAAGLDPERFSGHSLRAGLITEAARRGYSERAIARTSRHASVAVLRRYVRHADIWTENVTAKGIGL